LLHHSLYSRGNATTPAALRSVASGQIHSHVLQSKGRSRQNSAQKTDEKEPRAEKVSEFSKYGMAKRVFQYLRRHIDPQDQRYSPQVVFEIVLEELERLAGSEGRHLAIPNVHFLDDHERVSLSRKAIRRLTLQEVSSMSEY